MENPAAVRGKDIMMLILLLGAVVVASAANEATVVIVAGAVSIALGCLWFVLSAGLAK